MPLIFRLRVVLVGRGGIIVLFMINLRIGRTRGLRPRGIKRCGIGARWFPTRIPFLTRFFGARVPGALFWWRRLFRGILSTSI